MAEVREYEPPAKSLRDHEHAYQWHADRQVYLCIRLGCGVSKPKPKD